MRRALLAPFLLLGASGDGQDGTVQPGYWETQAAVIAVRAPGLPREQLDEIERQLKAGEAPQRRCITPEEAANPQNQVIRAPNSQDCRFSERLFSGGRIQVRGSCPAPDGSRISLLWTGSYTATTIDTELVSETTSGSMPMQTTTRLTSRHIGDCPQR